MSDIRKAKDKLREYNTKCSVDGASSISGVLKSRKHMKRGGIKDIDEAVHKWHVQQHSVGVKVRAVDIMKAAEELAGHLGVQQFKFKVCGEAGSAVTGNIEPFRLKLNDLIKKEGLLLSQVYNGDETGLF